MSNRNITTAAEGSVGAGIAFEDSIGLLDLNKTAISRIVVTTDQYIRSLMVSRQTAVLRILLIARILGSLHRQSWSTTGENKLISQ